MKQIITINIGDPGIKIGDSTLSLYLQEHRLKTQEPNNLSESFPMHNDSVFHQVAEGRFQHRAMAVDCDMEAVNELQTGSRRQFYNPRYCMGSKQLSGGVFSNGHDIFDKKMLTTFEQNFQKMAEECDSLQGVVFNASTLGGTSGVLDRISSKLAGQNYLKNVPKIAFTEFPSKNYSSNVVETYNYTFSAVSLLEHFDLVIPFDNQSLYSHAVSQLDIEKPGYKEINDIVAQVQSSVTLSMRSKGVVDTKFNDLCTNMVCYPRIHFTYPSLVGARGSRIRSKNNESITRQVLKPTSQLYNMIKLQNKIAVGLFYRGETTHFETMASLGKISSERPSYCIFEDWSPMGFKVALNDFPLGRDFSDEGSSSLSCCSLTSSLEFTFTLAHNNYKFDKLYAKRAFVHHYLERQIEEFRFSQVREDLAALEKDYEPCRAEYCMDESYEMNEEEQ